MDSDAAEMQHVLIADDDDDDFEFLAEAVNDLSLKIILSRAENGEILMKILHMEIPDVLFLDVMMPCVDGKECVHQIRSDKKFDDLPIIVYSAVRDPDTVEFFYRQGTNMYVFKPQSYSDLLSMLEKIFAIDWRKVRYYPKYNDFVLNPDG